CITDSVTVDQSPQLKQESIQMIFGFVGRGSYRFFLNDAATTVFHTLSLHDALPIWICGRHSGAKSSGSCSSLSWRSRPAGCTRRSEEHTSELQSRGHLVCRLLLEKKTNSHRTGARTFAVIRCSHAS